MQEIAFTMMLLHVAKKEVARCVREHNENVELRAIDYVQKWLCALNGVKNKAEIFKEGEMRRYF